MLSSFKLLSAEVLSYPFMLGMIVALAYLYSRFLMNRNKVKVPHFKALFILLCLSSWIGAKVFFLLSSTRGLNHKILTNSSFWMGGGLVFFGGLLFGMSALILFSKLKNEKLKKFEFLIPVLALSHSLGRVACFMAGCCYGKPTELPWAVRLHNELRHPVQIYEALFLFLLFVFLHKRLLQKKSVFFIYLIAYSSMRFCLEFLRGDQIRGVYFESISTSQIIALFLISICLFILSKRKSSSFAQRM